MLENKAHLLKAGYTLQELTRTLWEYEHVITEDRIEKEKSRKKLEQEFFEIKSIIKLQAWWQVTMIWKETDGFKYLRRT